MKRLRFALAVLLVAFAWPVLANDGEGNCQNPLKLSEGFSPTLAKVIASEPKVYFRRNRSSQNTCPSEVSLCKSRAYLVPNDEIFAGPADGAYVCAAKLGAKDRVTVGWLQKSAIEQLPAAPVTLNDWLGTWVAPEQKIIIKRGKKPGTLALDATATFGALDPERVKRGAVNMGDFQAEWKPEGNFMAFTVGAKSTVAIDKEEGCKVHLLRIGAFLVTEDNSQCGGMNVSFTSVMRRGK